MVPDEYTSTRRTWFRDILVGVAAALGADLVRIAVQSVVHHLG